jgi:DNA-directed RNA polymerase specialized sigma24 family protein
VKAWLFTMACNALIDDFRKTNRWVELNDKDGTNESVTNNKMHNDTL